MEKQKKQHTLYVNGAKAFTAEMVVRVMTGDMNQNVTEKKIKRVVESLRKLSMIRLTIDYTNEWKERNKGKKAASSTERVTLTSYLMPVSETEIILVNGKKKNGFKILEKPVLYQYAEDARQIICVPTTLLEHSISSVCSSTEENVLIKRYLICRIDAMKNKNNSIVSNKIKYSWYDEKDKTMKGMFPFLGYDEKNYSNWRRKSRKSTRLCFTSWSPLKGTGTYQDTGQTRKAGQ